MRVEKDKEPRTLSPTCNEYLRRTLHATRWDGTGVGQHTLAWMLLMQESVHDGCYCEYFPSAPSLTEMCVMAAYHETAAACSPLTHALMLCHESGPQDERLRPLSTRIPAGDVSLPTAHTK